MNKEEFVKLIEDYQECNRKLDKLSDCGVNIYEWDLVEYTYNLFDRLLNAFYSKEIIDWIYWWLLERDGNPDIKAWDENNNEIPFDTIEDLWNFIKNI